MSTIHDASSGTCLWEGMFAGLHLQKGQGVAGRAYLSHNSCFCDDVTQFSLSDYPLAHYARKYGLAGSFAICLRSSYTGEDDYILEFFLPGNVTNEYPRTLLDWILATMKQHLSSFKVASGEELGVELSVEAITVNFSTVKKFDSFQICKTTVTRCPPMPEALQNGGEMVRADSSDEQLMVEDDAINNGRNTVSANGMDTAVNNSGKEGTIKTLKKTIPLEDIEPHFGKNLEDVAELFDISRSTFKRILRGHKIMRWRKHKRNKVNDSLSKRGPPCSNLPPKQAVATVDHTTPRVTAMQNVRTVIIKAKYGENTIKFPLSSSSGKEDLEQEITKGLKLKVGSFNIEYWDEDGEWILVACDDDLQDCMSSACTTTIRMQVQSVQLE
uniref:PB1 domain-containing protein n=1 Tax=Davidia involucrata TaxID=16924 RepID=A0A5B7AR89_DAVIN